jgi:hypothetical protein
MNKEEEITKIREFHVSIDTLINSTKFLVKSREIALCHTNLQRGKMWLGKSLASAGTENPYVNSSNPENKIIEPQAEHTEQNFGGEISALEHVPQVKLMRSKIQEQIDLFEEFIDSGMGMNGIYANRYLAYIMQSFYALEEAKMWLGWHLDEVRKQSGI